MPHNITAALDKVFVRLGLAYCMYLLIQATILIYNGRRRFRSFMNWEQPFASCNRESSDAASDAEYNIPNKLNRHHSLTGHQLPVQRVGLQHSSLPLKSKVYIAGTSSELSELATPSSSETSKQQPPRRKPRSANEPWDDAVCETDADLAKQAFRNMVRARRESSHQWLQARLAERRRPSYSLFGLRWPFS
jgi:hypothetical protein